MPTEQARLFLGTSGLVLPVPNKLFYPDEHREKSRLGYYGCLFNTIEVNSSFYKVPMATTVARWSDTVPDGFRFTYKLWKGITHNKQLTFKTADVHSFIKVIDHAGNKKGCLLVQFPGSITYEYVKPMKKLLQTIRSADKNGNWKLSVEFRHGSWYVEPVFHWLQQRQIAVVYHDIAPVPPKVDVTAGWAYLRFHGPEKGYKGSYSEELLAVYAKKIREIMAQGKAVYVYFNNTLGAPIENLNTLRELINLP